MGERKKVDKADYLLTGFDERWKPFLLISTIKGSMGSNIEMAHIALFPSPNIFLIGIKKL
jgi:hypothetical protein